jgi:hypothetical protein
MDIATSVNKIGEIINLSQELNTLMWDKLNKGASVESVMRLYCDIAQLDVMSNIEIDSAKKEYPVDNTRELSELKTKYLRRDKKGRRIMPNFFAPVSRKKGYYNPGKKAYVSHKITMDYLQKSIRELMLGKIIGKREFIPFADVLKPERVDLSSCKYEQIERVVNIVQTAKDDIDMVWRGSDDLDTSQKYSITDEIRQRCIDYVGGLSFSKTTMYRLLSLLDDNAYKSISRTLFLILFGAPNISFFQIIDDSRQPRDVLVEDRNGDIPIHDFKFTKQKLSQQFSDFIQF